ncbi:CAZyme family GH18 [Paecilomyces variotii]|nr:CAZyme family GH18 [Paecilomyces variotii]KAJ9278389.1 CAZyme family GH18 [Paecilomyces variotii]KAJ9339735.1 CAZyme family GH18 [Paecilomyces variotii]KAJ9382319.1 CAZyme family GH18 [Paecilomyces variotii]
MIPMGVYTHINYAFASIDPLTFEVRPANLDEVPLYSRLTALKNDDPDLKVNIAIGGWSFNDPGPTTTTFSDLAASEENQRKFFKSLTSFLATYNFDGVDIDWEYPAADDRSGRPEDFANFPKFIANLKRALQGTGGRDGLSVTLPASYWYLQHFDIQNLAKNVDYFNVMSYDLHGTWDKGNKWTGAFLDSHTNLTEIETVLDLIWRNDINADQIVLGLAFYGRAFTVADTSCMTPGCMFASGSNPGPCSHTSSMLMNSEIDQIIADRNLQPTLDVNAAVKLLSWDDQWVTYDDYDTFSIKTDFARSECLGGVMVWAISHDTADGKYSEALSRVTSRSFTSLSIKVKEGTESSDLTVISKQHQQCKWTGCRENCPAGYAMISRSDPGYRKGEYMYDETGCDGDGHHTLCCPVNQNPPRCGWYTHNNGKCNSACPNGMLEIGSNSMYCNNDDYQAACCESSKDSMKLYTTLEWSRAPYCDSGECPWSDSAKTKTLVTSTTGSGGAICNMRAAGYPGSGIFVVQERMLCYNDGIQDMSWDSCAWYDSEGPVPAGRSNSFCRSQCPSDRVRVAMDGYSQQCLGKGGSRAYCCVPGYYDVIENPDLTNFRDSLQNFVTEPTCPKHDSYSRRKRSHDGRGTAETSLMERDVTLDRYTMVVTVMSALLRARSYTALQQQQANIWDSVVPSMYPDLTMSNIRSFMGTWRPFRIDGADEAAHRLTCRMVAFEDRISGKRNVNCVVNLCEIEVGLCTPEDDVGDPGTTARRSSDLTTQGTKKRGTVPGIYHALESRSGSDEKRYQVWCAATGNTRAASYWSAPYYSAGEWPSDNPIYDDAKDYEDWEDCGNPEIASYTIPTGRFYHTEHIIEIQTFQRFFYMATTAKLPSGATPNFQPIDCSFFVIDRALDSRLLVGVPSTFLGGIESDYPSVRIMDALGSSTNTADFYLLHEEINGMKARLWRGDAPVEYDKMKAYADNTNAPEIPLNLIKCVIAVFNYLNKPNVKASMETISNHVRDQFQLTQDAYNFQHGTTIDLVAAWDEFIRDLLGDIVTKGLDFVTDWITYMTTVWSAQGLDPVQQALVFSALGSLSGAAPNCIRIDISGLD